MPTIRIEYEDKSVIETWHVSNDDAIRTGVWLDENVGPADLYEEN